MTTQDIIRYRLYNQQLLRSKFKKPEEVVSWLGAVQAQDYPGGLWGIGLRLPGTKLPDVEKMLVDRKVIRTWPMRGTLHFVPARDAKWMLELLASKVIRGSGSRHRELGLNEEVFKKSEKILAKALKGGKQLTRLEMVSALAKGGIKTDGQRGYHILGHLAQKAIICFGIKRDKQQTFVLFDEWISKSKKLSREESITELTRRYFTGHGPAQIEDLMWWSGLNKTEVKEGLEANKTKLSSDIVNGKTYWFAKNLPVLKTEPMMAYLLPTYDEFLISYKDRSASLDPANKEKLINSLNMTFISAIIIDGKAVGMWKRLLKKNEVLIEIKPFTPLNRVQKDALTQAVERYGKFIGMPAKIII